MQLDLSKVNRGHFPVQEEGSVEGDNQRTEDTYERVAQRRE